MDYTTIQAVRSLGGCEDFTDAEVEEAVDYAEFVVDDTTGTSWTYKPFSLTLTGSGSSTLRLVKNDGRLVLFPRTLTAVSIGGEAVDSGAYSLWGLQDHGAIVKGGGCFPSSTVGGNITITGTAGLTSSAPVDIVYCTKRIARHFLLESTSRQPETVTSIQSPDGNLTLAVASAHPDRPTALPEVNARLIRRRQIGPTIY